MKKIIFWLVTLAIMFFALSAPIWSLWITTMLFIGS